MLDRKPKQLSGGQRQRVALGRAIVRNPKVFLMDEPLSNLDANLRVQMRAEIKRLHKELNTTFVYVTHDQTEALTMGDRIVVLDKGKIQQVDTPEVVQVLLGKQILLKLSLKIIGLRLKMKNLYCLLNQINQN